ncbi:TspO/MBR family protein [uncultured Brevibacillus sp.]|uniref:TspO/MBR family protein n=1 Tax=uncultured Brevibacillus sp. TaxID=169970 RepID=UPI0025930A4A|nr:TspO/MBR family protein [uncultured Brevibacillus sp.]
MIILRDGLLFLVVVALYSLAGFAFPGGGAWYESLTKPDGTPSTSLLAVIWFVLHLLIAFSVVMLVRAGQMNQELLLLFGINWFFNQLFPLLLFGLQQLFLATMDMVFVTYSTWVLIRASRSHNKIASSLLIPYLQWSAFAICLAVGFCWINL